MTLDKFKKVIETMQKHNESIVDLYAFGIDIANARFVEAFDRLSYLFLEEFLTDQGIETVEWWLYDDVDHTLIEDGEKIDCNSIEGLYNYLKGHELLLPSKKRF